MSQSEKTHYINSEMLADLSAEIIRGLSKMPFETGVKHLSDKKAFRKLVLEKACEIKIAVTTQTSEILRQLQLLVVFYKEVCDVDVSFVLEREKEISLEGKFQTLGLTVSSLSTKDMMEAYKKKWDINLGWYQDPNTAVDQQERPKADFQLFAHKGGAEPDGEFLNTSFNQFIKMDLPFASAKEYIAMQGVYKFATGKWMDKKGWTRTTSLWSGGKLVIGRWDPFNSGLELGCDYVSNQSSVYGPRQLVLL